MRTVPIPDWVAEAVAVWLREAGITEGAVFRAINKAARIAPAGFSPKVIWGVVKQAAARCGMANVAPHDLRRTCARLCHQAGGELEQIQFLLGHVSSSVLSGCHQPQRRWLSLLQRQIQEPMWRPYQPYGASSKPDRNSSPIVSKIALSASSALAVDCDLV